MGRGVSSGGGQSSLGYLFGSGEEPKTIIKSAPASSEPAAVMAMPIQKSVPSSEVNTKQIPAGIPGNHANNYFRADGQNSGNFITVCFPSLHIVNYKYLTPKYISFIDLDVIAGSAINEGSFCPWWWFFSWLSIWWQLRGWKLGSPPGIIVRLAALNQLFKNYSYF